MLDYPCPVCRDYRCSQQHGWCYMDDSVLFQTLLEGFEEMVRRSSNARAPYLGGAGMMDSPSQYIYSPGYPPIIYPPASNAADAFGTKAMDALVDRMLVTHISPPTSSTDIWAAQGSASVAPNYQEGFAPSPEYDVLALWPEGYVGVPQDAEDVADLDDEDISYGEQHVNSVEPSFIATVPTVPTAPGPVPSISVTEHLEQGTFQHRQLVKGTPAGPIHFNGDLGVCYKELDALADGAQPAFSPAASIGLKAYIRFELLGLPGQEMRQLRVRHGGGKGKEGQPFTMRQMGERVFGELKKVMDHAKDRGEPLQHHGVLVDIEKVVLLRIDHISQGTLKPILGIRSDG